MANPYQAYQKNSVNTASPGELTLMLYNGCLKFIRQGRQAIENDDLENKNTNLQKAQRIIQELMTTMDANVPISKDIMPLYEYINRRLVEANINSEIDILDEVAELVTEFRDTWKQVIQLNRQQQHGQGSQV